MRAIHTVAVVLLSTSLVTCTGLGANSPGPTSAPSGAFVSAEATEVMDRCHQHAERVKALRQAITNATGERTRENTLEPFNEIAFELEVGVNQADLLAYVHPDPEVRQAGERCQQELMRLDADIRLDRSIYEAFVAVDTSKLDADARRLVKVTLQDFRRAGVDRDEETREAIKRLNEELVLKGQAFSRAIREDTRKIKLYSVEDLAGLPQDYIDAHSPGPDGTITITTDYPDYVPFMNYSERPDLRRALYMEYNNRGYPENLENLSRLLIGRQRLATLLGYENWAGYDTEDKMIRTTDAAQKFVDKISDLARKRMENDLAVLLERKRKDHPLATRVAHWEQAYYRNLVKAESYDFDPQEVRPYFEVNRVKEGVLQVTSNLFGLTYRPVKDADSWHERVEFYDVYDGETKIGRFFLDLYPRPGKYKHAAQFSVIPGVRGKSLPLGGLVANFPDPEASAGPALMDHEDVQTLFHEFGHLLQHLLAGQQEWVRFSGRTLEWDFVEVPSQLLEEWAWDPTVLATFARHVETNEPIPAHLVQRMKAADSFGKGIWVSQQMFYAAISLNYHNDYPQAMDTTALLRDLQGKYSPFPYEQGSHMQASFGHLDGYAASYYTYMWSLVIAKDMANRFKTAGLMNPQVAQEYRDKVLEPGGTADSAELVRDFLGRDYSFDPFQAWLLE